jgi:hypothetical protein
MTSPNNKGRNMKLLIIGLLATLSINSFAANLDNQTTIKCEKSEYVNPSTSSLIVSEVCWDDSIQDSDDIISEKIISSVKCDLDSTCFKK